MAALNSIVVFVWLLSTLAGTSEISLQERMKKMENNISDMKKQQEEMMSRMTSHLNSFMADIKTREEKVERSLLEMKESFYELQEKCEIARAPSSAFTVYMTTNVETQEPATVILPFDSVITNIGENFDIGSYKFTCPIDGLYFFSFSLQSGTLIYQTDYYLRSYSELVMDDVVIVEARVRNEDTNHAAAGQGSNAAMVVCSAGSQVWLQTSGDNASLRIRGHSTYRFSTFSGVLMQNLSPK